MGHVTNVSINSHALLLCLIFSLNMILMCNSVGSGLTFCESDIDCPNFGSTNGIPSCRYGPMLTGIVSFFGFRCDLYEPYAKFYSPRYGCPCRAGKILVSVLENFNCTYCSAGTYSIGWNRDWNCKICDAGKYNSAQGSTACISCEAGTYSSAWGTTTCASCEAGTYSSSQNTAGCISCGAGKYSETNGAKIDSECKSCDTGTYSTVIGAINPITCTACIWDQCPLPGQYSSCGLNTSGNCISCENTPSPNTAYYAVSSTTGLNSTCPTSIASPGYYRNCTTPLTPMWIGDPPIQYGPDCSFRDIINSQPYYYCSSYGMYMWWQNTQWVGSEVFANLGTDTFTASGPGLEVSPSSDYYYYNQPMIILLKNLAQPFVNWVNPCSKGTYASLQGATACISASPGYYVSSPSATSQTPCPAGLHSSTGASSCTTACTAGTYNSTSSQCSPVNPGYYSKTGTPIPCPRGTFSSMAGASMCGSCAAGTFNNLIGMSSISACTPCASGSYSASSIGSSSTCTLCTPGLYTAVSGSTSCTRCQIGKYTPINGTATDCTWCTNGTSYTTTTSSSTCTTCSKTCAAGLQIQRQCIPISDIYCGACAPIVNCVFIPGTVCGNTTHPNCLCPPGLEMSDGQCQECKSGFFKSTNSTMACTPWTNVRLCPIGQFFVSNGTRFTDTACLRCPTQLPANGSAPSRTGCQWGCMAGYNRTVFR